MIETNVLYTKLTYTLVQINTMTGYDLDVFYTPGDFVDIFKFFIQAYVSV